MELAQARSSSSTELTLTHDIDITCSYSGNSSRSHSSEFTNMTLYNYAVFTPVIITVSGNVTVYSTESSYTGTSYYITFGSSDSYSVELWETRLSTSTKYTSYEVSGSSSLLVKNASNGITPLFHTSIYSYIATLASGGLQVLVGTSTTTGYRVYGYDLIISIYKGDPLYTYSIS